MMESRPICDPQMEILSLEALELCILMATRAARDTEC